MLQGHHRIFVVDPAKAHTVTVHGSTVVINIKVRRVAGLDNWRFTCHSGAVSDSLPRSCLGIARASTQRGLLLVFTERWVVLSYLLMASVVDWPLQPGTEKPEASGLRPTDIVSQLDVVKLLSEHKDKLELVMGKTLEDLEIFEVGCSVFLILDPTMAKALLSSGCIS